MITSTCITKYYAALDRIDYTRLSDDKPIRKMTNLPIFTILLTNETEFCYDCRALAE